MCTCYPFTSTEFRRNLQYHQCGSKMLSLIRIDITSIELFRDQEFQYHKRTRLQKNWLTSFAASIFVTRELLIVIPFGPFNRNWMFIIDRIVRFINRPGSSPVKVALASICFFPYLSGRQCIKIKALLKTNENLSLLLLVHAADNGASARAMLVLLFVGEWQHHRMHQARFFFLLLKELVTA